MYKGIIRKNVWIITYDMNEYSAFYCCYTVAFTGAKVEPALYSVKFFILVVSNLGVEPLLKVTRWNVRGHDSSATQTSIHVLDFFLLLFFSSNLCFEMKSCEKFKGELALWWTCRQLNDIWNVTKGPDHTLLFLWSVTSDKALTMHCN